MSLPHPASNGDLIVPHVPFVRALARELVFDADLARDVEQDVLLAALQNAPRDPRSIKGWLASIVRHVASNAFRARTRRVAREAEAPSQSVPTPEEILAREDVRRSLIEHVLSLDKPLRDVMILRFFEDLPPREVARRLAIPVETVRTRTKRGVELLRSRLERGPCGGKGAWCLALVTGLKIEPPSLFLAGATILGAGLPGVLAMSVSKKLAAVVALILLASTAWYAIERGEPEFSSHHAVSAAPQSRELVPASAESPALALSADSRTTIASPAPAKSSETAPTTGSVRVILHWFDGTPAAGVNVRISRSGMPFDDAEFDGTTGDDGTRLIEAVAPGQKQIEFDRGTSDLLEVLAGECAIVEKTFARGFDISGRVVERGGRTLADAEILMPWGRSEHVVGRSDSNGSFKIRSLREGLVWVSARAVLHAPSARRELTGGSTGFENVELVLDPSGAALDGIVYGFDGQPLPHARVLVGEERPFDAVFFEDGGRGRVPATQELECDERGRFAFTGVPVGRIPLAVRAAEHSPWKGEVETIDQRTAHAEIRLVRCTTLTGRVTDSSGVPVVRATVIGGEKNTFLARLAHTGDDGTFSMSGLPASEFQVSVEAKGFEDAKTTLLGFPGAQLTWEPVLGTGNSIRGRLVLADFDFSKWTVECESQDRGGKNYEPSFSAHVRPAVDGSFEIRGCADVGHKIEVHQDSSERVNFPIAQRKDVHPGGPELVIAIEPTSLASCRLRGRFVDDRNQPVAGIEYFPGRADVHGAPVLIADADGSFDIGPVPPGRYWVGVYAAGFAPFSSEQVDVGAGETFNFGDLRLQRGGTIVVHLTRDPALAGAEFELYAIKPGSGSSFVMPVLDSLAHSPVLAPGDYVVEIIGNAEANVAQRTARATVRTGEETSIDLRADPGARIKVLITPSGSEQAAVQAFDAAGGLLWEGQGWQTASLVLPLQTVRLVARDEAGRTAEASFSSLASIPAGVLTLGLK